MRAELIAQGALGCLDDALTPTAAEISGAETPAPELEPAAATAPKAEEAPTIEPRTLPMPRKLADREAVVERAAKQAAKRVAAQAGTVAALARGLIP